jgi:Na+/H+-dicarboxylate symporter
MSLFIAVIIGILMGVVFGFALEKSRVFEPGIIVGQMQLRNFIMPKVFLTAVATGAVALAVLNDRRPPVRVAGSQWPTSRPAAGAVHHIRS